MKNVTFTATFTNSEGDKTHFTQHAKANSANLKNVCAVILIELFSWVTLCKKLNARGADLGKPVDLKFSFDGHSYDTAKIKKQLREKLRLQNNGAGKKRYAVRFYSIMQWIIEERKAMTFDQLIASLDSEITKESQLN